MSVCPDCGEGRAHVKSNLTGNIFRCSTCDDVAREATGIKRDGFAMVAKGRGGVDFKPYWLNSGPLCRVEDDPHFNHETRQIHVNTRKHERDIMKRMDSHFGETGELVQGHKLGYDKPVHGEKSSISFRR